MKTLIRTNPFLSKPSVRKKLLFWHAVASARIEGVKDADKRLLRISKKTVKLAAVKRGR